MSNLSRSQKTAEKHSGMSKDQVFELEQGRVANERLKIQFAGSGVLLVLAAAPLAVMIPIATALAGKETILNVSVAVTITAALTVTNGVTGVVSRRRGKEVNRLEERNEKLAKQLHRAQDRLRKANLDPVLTSGEDR